MFSFFGILIRYMQVKVRVYPDSKKESVVQKRNGAYEICVKAPQERNEANKRAIILLAETLGTTKLRIVHGHRKPNKIIEVSINT